MWRLLITIQYLTGTSTSPLLLHDVADTIQSGFHACLVIVFQVAEGVLHRNYY